MLESGATLDDKYEVLRELGQGGMAVVYACRHLRANTLHAVKVLHGNLARYPDILRRLQREGEIAGRVRHPNIVAVTDWVRQPAPGLVMELVEGPSLDDHAAGRRFATEEVRALILPVIDALEAAHAQGVVHRDLKPQNILVATLNGQPWPKITDFGIARVAAEASQGLTRANATMGTPGYMSPEQIRSAAQVDHRTDLFAVGAILYELLAGERAFSGDNDYEVQRAVVRGAYRDIADVVPGVAPWLTACIRRALQVRPEDRFQSCAEFRAALLDSSVRVPASAGAGRVWRPHVIVAEGKGGLASAEHLLRHLQRRPAESCAIVLADEPAEGGITDAFARARSEALAHRLRAHGWAPPAVVDTIHVLVVRDLLAPQLGCPGVVALPRGECVAVTELRWVPEAAGPALEPDGSLVAAAEGRYRLVLLTQAASSGRVMSREDLALTSAGLLEAAVLGVDEGHVVPQWEATLGPPRQQSSLSAGARRVELHSERRLWRALSLALSQRLMTLSHPAVGRELFAARARDALVRCLGELGTLALSNGGLQAVSDEGRRALDRLQQALRSEARSPSSGSRTVIDPEPGGWIRPGDVASVLEELAETLRRWRPSALPPSPSRVRPGGIVGWMKGLLPATHTPPSRETEPPLRYDALRAVVADRVEHFLVMARELRSPPASPPTDEVRLEFAGAAAVATVRSLEPHCVEALDRRSQDAAITALSGAVIEGVLSSSPGQDAAAWTLALEAAARVAWPEARGGALLAACRLSAKLRHDVSAFLLNTPLAVRGVEAMAGAVAFLASRDAHESAAELDPSREAVIPLSLGDGLAWTMVRVLPCTAPATEKDLT